MKPTLDMVVLFIEGFPDTFLFETGRTLKLKCKEDRISAEGQEVFASDSDIIPHHPW